MTEIPLHPDRYFSPEPAQREVAAQLYNHVADLPLVCPHGHVDPRLFSDPDYAFGSPTELFLIPDHYIFRMLYSQGVALEALAIPRRDGGESEADHRKAWQLFADHYHLFQGTPTGLWLREEFAQLFGITEALNGRNAQTIYDQIDSQLHSPESRPRRLYERFNIEVLCTTDAATDTLVHHQAIRDSGWNGRILPTFRPDAVVNLDTENWRDHIAALSDVSGIDVVDVASFMQALEQRRAFFKKMGAKATDHAALTAVTQSLSATEAETIFQQALRGETTPAASSPTFGSATLIWRPVSWVHLTCATSSLALAISISLTTYSCKRAAHRDSTPSRREPQRFGNGGTVSSQMAHSKTQR